MQHRPVPSPTPLPSLASFDQEFEGTIQFGPERPFRPKRLLGIYAGLLAVSLILMATSILSTAPQLWSLVEKLGSSPAEHSQSHISTLTPDLFTQMHVLRRELSLQQDTSAKIAELHLDQQELRRSELEPGRGIPSRMG
jgi:hypothetical protein